MIKEHTRWMSKMSEDERAVGNGVGDRRDAAVGETSAGEPICSGRFWALSPEASDDDLSGELSPEGKGSFRYLCGTPEEDSRRNLSSRKEKRDDRRWMQRWAAVTLATSPPSSEERVTGNSAQPRCPRYGIGN
jgi:hypothetical protein